MAVVLFVFYYFVILLYDINQWQFYYLCCTHYFVVLYQPLAVFLDVLYYCYLFCCIVSTSGSCNVCFIIVLYFLLYYVNQWQLYCFYCVIVLCCDDRDAQTRVLCKLHKLNYVYLINKIKYSFTNIY
jgi:hypothetical protein